VARAAREKQIRIIGKSRIFISAGLKLPNSGLISNQIMLIGSGPSNTKPAHKKKGR
jgi:hypothetical protein